MRLRLTVQRNSLPPTNIVWSVPDTNSPQAYTIARLLEDINHVLPLEAEHWGLEDYTVEVGGFECLHFLPVVQALKEDDHVSIRPLLTAEVRARTLCGRHQISDGGQHLVDGVPFGRPYLRQPNRPAVAIPPRKRQRLEYTNGESDGTEITGLITVNGEPSLQFGGNDSMANGVTHHDQDTIPRSRKSQKMVQFQQPEVDPSDSDEDEEDDDFAPSEDDESDISTEDNSSGASRDSSSASDTSSSDSASDSGSDTDTDSSTSDSSSESGAGSIPDITTSHVPPGQGASKTQSRNARRRQSKQLRRLKEAGKLDEHADFEALKEYQEWKEGLPIEGLQTIPEFISQSERRSISFFSGKRKRLDDESSAEGVSDESAELARRKQDLIAKFGGETSTTKSPSAQEPVKPSPKRLRPDTLAIGRILARHARSASKQAPKAKALALEAEEPTEPEGASDPDFWKSRINLSAFECWNEEFTLSAPPFPFKQHWDPACQLMRDKQNKKKQRQKKSGKKASPPNSPPADDVESILLNYDDVPMVEKSESDPSAAIESQLLQDARAAAKSDLPPLPEDVDSLPALSPSETKVGAIVVFKLWVINPTTVCPEITNYKTAIVEKEGDSGNGAGTMRLKFAERDIEKREKRYDEQGNRIFDAADTFRIDVDEEEDDGTWEGTFNELVDPRLLKAA